MNSEIDLTEHWQPIVQAIHDGEFQAVLAVTGGGSGALSALLETPGASRTVLEAVVPYSAESLRQWIGGTPDQACSEATARAMAMAAWMRAREFAPDADPAKLIGLGSTASLATDRAKRGDHRVHVALQTGAFTRTCKLSFDSDRKRPEEERLATCLILCLLAESAEVDCERVSIAIEEALQTDERLTKKEQAALPRWWRLILQDFQSTSVRAPDQPAGQEVSWRKLLFPGSFNPLHKGHLRMAEIAEQRIAKPLAWELSLMNVDKPPMDCLTLEERLAAIHEIDPSRPIEVSTMATFAEKSEVSEDITFVVGLDTILRIDDLKYYANESARDSAFATIKSAGCKFLVFGRNIDGNFQVLSDIQLSPALRELCEEVTAEEFREDISSTQLRTQP
ncbi:MAG: hypothetical protein RH917_08505 [Lacipirellulaceae bacterium]